MNRRRFLFSTSTLAFSTFGSFASDSSSANAFSRIKNKLSGNRDAVLFINGDSTSYSKYGPYYLFARSIGDSMDCKVVVHRWAEWGKTGPTGPKEYEAPEILRDSGKATLTIYLATLPGSVPTDMFSGARRPKAIDAIPAPDCCILHHGHNMRGFPQAFPDDFSSGRGMILSAICMTSMKWPEAPQAITTQNPWKNGDEYKAVLDSIQSAAQAQPSITLVNSHDSFITAGKTPDLYRPNDVIHPSDSATNSKGAQLVADALLAAWTAAAPGDRFTTPSSPDTPAANLLGTGGEFAHGIPDGWALVNGATAEVIDQTAAVRPNGNPQASISRTFSATDIAAVAGKTITITAIVRSSPAQIRAFGNFVCRSNGLTRTFSFADQGTCKDGWLLLVCSGIAVDADQPSPVTLRYFPALSSTPPKSDDPLFVSKIVITEGLLPKGLR